MTDTEIVTEVRTIIAERVRSRDRITADLGKYDRIVGLLRRESTTAEPAEAEVKP